MTASTSRGSLAFADIVPAAARPGFVGAGFIPARFGLAAMDQRSDSRVDAASCGSHDQAGDANSTPATCGLLLSKSGRWQACSLAALRAAGWRGGRPHPAGSWVARRTNAPPASMPAELADRTTYRMRALRTSTPGRSFPTDASSVTSARGRRVSELKGAGQGSPAPGWSIAHKR